MKLSKQDYQDKLKTCEMDKRQLQRLDGGAYQTDSLAEINKKIKYYKRRINNLMEVSR